MYSLINDVQGSAFAAWFLPGHRLTAPHAKSTEMLDQVLTVTRTYAPWSQERLQQGTPGFLGCELRGAPVYGLSKHGDM